MQLRERGGWKRAACCGGKRERIHPEGRVGVMSRIREAIVIGCLLGADADECWVSPSRRPFPLPFLPCSSVPSFPCGFLSPPLLPLFTSQTIPCVFSQMSSPSACGSYFIDKTLGILKSSWLAYVSEVDITKYPWILRYKKKIQIFNILVKLELHRCVPDSPRYTSS